MIVVTVVSALGLVKVTALLALDILCRASIMLFVSDGHAKQPSAWGLSRTVASCNRAGVAFHVQVAAA
jgi:hypothetical protein